MEGDLHITVDHDRDHMEVSREGKTTKISSGSVAYSNGDCCWKCACSDISMTISTGIYCGPIQVVPPLRR